MYSTAIFCDSLILAVESVRTHHEWLQMTLNVDFIIELVLDWFIPEPTMSHFNNNIR